MTKNATKWSQMTLSHFQQVAPRAKSAGYKMWVTMLYGSQNYGLETEESDVDTKTMVIPTIKTLARSTKPLTTEYVMEDGSLDNCKDLREMFQNYLKGNINFVETLYTPYYEVMEEFRSEYAALRLMRDRIANARPVKLVHMAGGMAEQKYVAFNKAFAGKADVLAKYGYDPKQLHHQYRLLCFIENYLTNMDFHQALLCCHPQTNHLLAHKVMLLKTDPLNYTEACKLREEFHDRINEMVDSAAQRLPEDNGYDVAEYQLNHIAELVLEKSLMLDAKSIVTCQ